MRLEELHWHTQSRALAASSVWSKSAVQALSRFEQSLRVDTADEHEGKPVDYGRLYRTAGVPVQPLQ